MAAARFGGLKGAAAAAANSVGSSAAVPMYVTIQSPTLRTALIGRLPGFLGVFLTLALVHSYLEGGAGGLKSAMTTSNEPKPEDNLSRVTFTDVKGVDEAVQELKELVLFLKEPQRFTRLGGKLPKGVLLLGPPGTGKTLLARAVAGEAGVPFFSMAGSEFEEVFVGVGAKRVRDLFAAAKKKAPCIIFIDEIDAVGSKRSAKDQQFIRMTLNQLLVELDGFDQKEGIIVMAATNFPDSLDSALTRAGRFDRHITVPLPDVKGRKQILELYLKDIPVHRAVSVDVLSRGTPGFSGADLTNMINVAVIEASKEDRSQVEMRHLEYAIDRIAMGMERKSAIISEKDRRTTAYHEGGHTLVAMFTEGTLPIHKVTIIPRGQALGLTKQLPDGDVNSVSRAELRARLDVCMGGKVAEELIFGSDAVTSGASSDLEHATRIARNMVLRYGMSDKLGPVSFSPDDVPLLSSETRLLLDTEVRALLDLSYARAKANLKAHEKELHLLAAALLEHETLTGDECKLVVQGKKLEATSSHLPLLGGAAAATATATIIAANVAEPPGA
jgi:ATP-dependent metalloprotease